jgi:hypothetical protein
MSNQQVLHQSESFGAMRGSGSSGNCTSAPRAPRSALLVNPAKTYQGARVLRFLLWGVIKLFFSAVWFWSVLSLSWSEAWRVAAAHSLWFDIRGHRVADDRLATPKTANKAISPPVTE